MTSTASVERDEPLRLFLALRLPEGVVAALEEWAVAELAGGKRVPRDHLHVTLAFLGTRPSRDLPAIAEALRDAASAHDAFPLEAARYRETRSVGMIVLDDPTRAATALAVDLHHRLEQLGVYRRETRRWLPHVTVLRFRERPRLRPPLPQLGTFVPSDAGVFLSRLHPSGARYEVLETVPLVR
jgi:2'-5' RNA ligase